MNITDIANLINQRLIINYRCNVEPSAQWYAHFESAELKQGGILIGVYGNGATPDEAIENYCREIAGKLIVFNAMKPSRMEFTMPENLTLK
jgi:hypothetical protein